MDRACRGAGSLEFLHEGMRCERPSHGRRILVDSRSERQTPARAVETRIGHPSGGPERFAQRPPLPIRFDCDRAPLIVAGARVGAVGCAIGRLVPHPARDGATHLAVDFGDIQESGANSLKCTSIKGGEPLNGVPSRPNTAREWVFTPATAISRPGGAGDSGITETVAREKGDVLKPASGFFSLGTRLASVRSSTTTMAPDSTPASGTDHGLTAVNNPAGN